MPVIVYNFLLQFARIHVRSAPLERVLCALGDAVSTSDRVIQRAKASGDEDYYDGVCDEESDVVENLIGAAFVTAQSQITGVVSSVRRLVTTASAEGHTLTSSTGSKEAIRQMASPVVASSPFTRIQVINAMANFFKHHDEWTVPWSRLPGNQKRTADIVVAIGGSQGSTGNLRTGLQALGIDYGVLSDLHEEVSAWAKAVIDTYEHELRARGLVGRAANNQPE